MCKGSQTTTSNSQYAPNPQALGAYSNLISQAQGVAGTPYVPYTGELVAPVNPQESAGIGNVNASAQFSLPSSMAGLSLAEQASQPITPGQISQYESPFTQQVVNATQNQFNNQNAQQMAQVRGNAIAQGAMGGDREAIAEAETANQQQLAQAPVIAGLENTGYQTGLNTALTEQQAQLMGGYGVAGIGTAAQNALLSGAGQQIGAGQLQQTTQQAEDAARYQQYLNAFAYPFQTNQWLAGIEGSIGPQMGGSGTAQTTGPAPSMLSQIGGLGTLATGLGGSSGLLSSLAMLPFSDERVKENIKAIGRLNDGQIIYRFNYKGNPATHIGLLAQQVEKKHPEAVHKDTSGLRHVDYDKATRDSEGVAKRDMGGGMEGYPSGYPMGVAGGVQNAPTAPYGHPGGTSYVPAAQLSPAYPFSWRLPSPPSLPNDRGNPSATGTGVAQLAQGIFGKMNGKAPASDTSFDQDTGPIGESPEVGPLGPIYRRGGGVHSFADGGGELGELLPPPIDLSGGQNGVSAPVVASASPTDVTPPPSSDDVSLAPPPARVADDVGVPMPRSRPPGLGVAAPPMALESSGYNAPEPGGDYGQNDITRWQHSIGGIESGNDYTKLGSVTRSGDQAYGRYGIMGNNIGPWTQQILGKAMTPQQFLASPEAQDAVFRAKFGDYVNKYGPEGAARAWYAGPGGMNNLGSTAHDANGNPIGVTVANYGQRFLRGLGLPVGDISNSTLPVNAQPTQGPAPPVGQDQGQGVAGGQNFLQKLFPNTDFSANSKLWPALIAAGAGMMSSRSPFAGVAIGEGAQAGLQEYQYEKAAEQAGGIKQTELQQNAQKLQREADQFALNYQIQLKKLEQEQKKEEWEEAAPKTVQDPFFGQRTILRDKDGNWRYTDTGEPVIGPAGSAGSEAGGPAPVQPQTDDPSRPFKNATPSAATTMKALQMGLHGQAMLDSLPIMMRNTLEAVANYDAPITDFTKMGRGGMSQDRALALVRAVNPEYNQNWYALQGTAFKNFFTGTSPQSPNVLSRAYNTAIGHAGELAEDIKLLHTANPGIFQEARNAGVPFLSYLAANWQQKAAKGTPTGEAWARIGAVLPLYSAETSRFYSGATGSQTEKEEVQAPFNPNLSYPEMMSALQQQKEMFKSKVAPLEQEYASVMDAPGMKEYGTKQNVKQWYVARDAAKQAEQRIEQLYQESGGRVGGAGTGTKLTPPVPGAKYYQGQWYTRGPNGEAVAVPAQ